MLEGIARRLVAAGDFAALRAHDAARMQCIKAVGTGQLGALLACVRERVILADFSKVA